MRILGLLALLSIPALADPARDAVKAGVARCDAVTDNRAWLDCFYGAAQPMRATLGLSPAPQIAPVASAAPLPPREAPPQQGMFDDLFGPGTRLVRALHLREVRFNRDGTFVLTLEDGQLWKQNSPPSPRADFSAAPSSYVVDIISGIMGSDTLHIRGVKQAYKVHRIG